WDAQGTSEPKEMILITQSLKELQQVMSDYVGIVRNNRRLQRALRRIDLLWEETEQLYQNTSLSPQLLELRNLISVGYLIVKCAAFRKESRGLHYNTDYPGKSELVQNIVLERLSVRAMYYLVFGILYLISLLPFFILYGLADFCF